MKFLPGNEYYKIRTKSGRDRIFNSPEELADKANEYFEWVLNNPFIESSIVNRPFKKQSGEKGDVKEIAPYSIAELPKMRPMTMQGLCNYIDIAMSTFQEYEKKSDFSAITKRIRQIIENHQFEGAASGFLNPNIIARKLGLSDKKDVTLREEQPLFPDGETDEEISQPNSSLIEGSEEEDPDHINFD